MRDSPKMSPLELAISFLPFFPRTGSPAFNRITFPQIIVAEPPPLSQAASHAAEAVDLRAFAAAGGHLSPFFGCCLCSLGPLLLYFPFRHFPVPRFPPPFDISGSSDSNPFSGPAFCSPVRRNFFRPVSHVTFPPRVVPPRRLDAAQVKVALPHQRLCPPSCFLAPSPEQKEIFFRCPVPDSARVAGGRGGFCFYDCSTSFFDVTQCT